ncbi:PTS sugar transporter subunit IIA [Enorma phocaeensis]|uniref:PTS sugar transporter subunit IIA n=1 Tax=Enorma phocaeensis TaxID=1871019 RepID=UPI00195A8B6C|nr:PTS sugar transporter subunit IIA [Enorma phocaeensis]
MLQPELFARNVQLQGGPDAYIDYLGSLCIAGEFADEDFIRDVHLRERISSTAFTERLAIPHSIDTYAARSFIAVLHNDTSIPWGRHDVNFVLLIGIAREDMGYFRDVLDIIIELFSSVDDTMRLMQTDTFEEFLRAFTHDLG